MPPETSAIATLGWIARAKVVASKNYPGAAEEWLAANRAPEQARRIYKAAIPAGSTTDSNLGEYGISIGQWSDSARTRSVFYRLLSDGAFTRVPMYDRVGMVVGTASGSLVAEGAATPVGKVTLANVQLQPMKALALIVCTAELLSNVSAAGQQLFNRELLGAVSDAVDGAFVNMLVDTASPAIASTSPLADLRAALLAVNSGSAGRLYWIAAPDVAKLASTVSTNAPAFAAASAAGGELANLPMLVSSGLADGTLALINGAAIAADGLAPSVDVSSQADIQMDTAPTMDSSVPTGTTVTSLFQSNSVALKATAIFAVEKLRADAVAVVTGITTSTWGA